MLVRVHPSSMSSGSMTATQSRPHSLHRQALTPTTSGSSKIDAGKLMTHTSSPKPTADAPPAAPPAPSRSGAPTVYIATLGDSRFLEHLTDEHAPSLLISYFYLRGWLNHPPQLRAPHPPRREVNIAREINGDVTTTYRSWCLDSGAFSAWNIGEPIRQADFVPVARDVWQADPTLDQVFALDAIGGDWRDTLRNTQELWAAGVPAIPTYHVGEPEDVLRGYARDFPKVAIGGMVPLKGQTKLRFAEQCFARVWPCALHGFGVGQQELAVALPWHSVDASSAEVGPRKYGNWYGFNGRREKVSVRRFYDLRVEVEFYMDLERTLRHRWQREMAELAVRLRAAGWRGYTEGD